MTRSNIPPFKCNPSKDAVVTLVRMQAVIGLGFFALKWMAFGVFAFCLIHKWGVEYDRKMAMIEHGEVKPGSLYVMGVTKDQDSGGWRVSFGKSGKAVAWRSAGNMGTSGSAAR